MEHLRAVTRAWRGPRWPAVSGSAATGSGPKLAAKIAARMLRAFEFEAAVQLGLETVDRFES